MRVNPLYIQGLVSALNQNAVTQQQYSTELSTGASVNSLSDNPVAAGEDYLLRSEQSVNDNFVQTASSSAGTLQVTDSALGSVVAQVTQAISLATEGNNGTLNADNLQSIADQLSGIRDEVLSLANTSYQGQYLFSGSLSATQPFALKTSTSPATVVYSGDSVQSTLKSPAGQSFVLNLPGNQIFGSGSTGVIATLNTLVQEFSSGVASSATVTATTALSAELQNISQQRVILDNSLSALQASSTYTQNQTIQLQSVQDTLVQANTAEVATELSASTTRNTALMDTIAALDQQGTLFNVLK